MGIRQAAFLGVLLFATACTSTSYDFSDLRPERPAASPAFGEVAVLNPRFDDRRPHPWDGRAPWTYPVHGTDVSRYQSGVDWNEVRRAGISFVFIKATEGGDMLDPHFHKHWRGATAAGLARSAYHFFYFCRPAREQAQWFIRNVPRDSSALPHVLDLEWNHLSPTCRLRPPAQTIQAEMRVFLDMLERHYGKRPIIYTTVDFYRDARLADFHGYDLWLRSVANHPDTPYDGRRFLFWQYTGTGIVPGISGNADINVFNGSAAQWRQWVHENTR